MDLSRSIVSFKAGRATRRGETNWVDPHATKGLVSIAPSDDGLLHFYWANRESNNIEEDLILFPGDASFVPVEEATGGRTYVLKFTSSDQRLFFWMQDGDTTRDSENVTKLNNALNQNADEGDAAMEPATSIPPEQLIPPQSTTAQAASQSGPFDQAEVDRLRNLLMSLGARGGASSSRGAAGLGFVEPELSLADLLTPLNLQPLLSNPTVLEQTVYPSLPTDLPVEASAATVKKVVESPPFQASLRQLDQAFATGMLQGLVVSLGLPAEAGGSMAAFLKAVGEQSKNPKDD